jgi:hypothetical protein
MKEKKNSKQKKVFTKYLNEDVNGFIFVSKTPMNQIYYITPAILKCIETKNKRITKSIFPGAICKDINGEMFKIIKIKLRKGYERKYIKEGNI